MNKITKWLKKILYWFLDTLFWLIDYWLKKIEYISKEIIVVFIVGIISLIVDDFFGVFFLYFILHWIYSCLRISSMKKDLEGANYWIDRLTRRNEALEKYIIELEEDKITKS